MRRSIRDIVQSFLSSPSGSRLEHTSDFEQQCPVESQPGLDVEASAPAIQLDLAPIWTMVPEAEPIRIGSYYAHMRGYYPYCEMQTKRWCVRNIGRDWRIFDVGGNIGYYSALFGRCAPDGFVVAFEPTETHRMLRHNLELNGISNVEVRQIAMGETEGNRRDAIFRVWGSPAEVEEFPFSTVDAEMQRLEWDRLDLLKVDVDSFDLEVLKGSLQTLDKFNPWVLVELNHALAERKQSVSQALEWLASVGYHEALVMDGENFLLRRPEGLPVAVEGLRLIHEREPVYVSPVLVATAAPAAEVAPAFEPAGAGVVDEETGDLIIDAPAWGYGLIWKVQPVCEGPAIVRLSVGVSGADIGVLCVREGFSELIGSEAFVLPGGEATVAIALDNVEDLRGIVIRKGPTLPGVARVRFSEPVVLQAEARRNATPSPSMNPLQKEIALSEAAKGLPSSSFDVPEDKLEIVDAHMLGERLGLDCSFRAPINLVNMPLTQFRMEVHDAKVLQQLYRAFRPKHHLEFGTWEGFGARLCLQNSEAHVWTLNLPEGEKDAEGRSLYSDASGVTDGGNRIGRLYREAGLASRVTQLLIDSREFDTSAFDSDFFDTALIDGGHTADVVANDTEKALQVVRPGGLVMWHDFCPDPSILAEQSASQGVVEAVLLNWKQWRPRFSSLFWVRPSWLLIGVVADGGMNASEHDDA
ncbi:class I SAM-dependent methyltransferase [Agrobacterium tumefaciens]|uniref:class I SAM-dependent methyltransferase n=1 Tax=Agrobacterium tumefaciens TaxID=358 RepID=UPI001574397C|nr:FkbM family methyltransferase [Agrobacterium tumefaciens]NTB05218.1 FkbM family methyltransferase [Agrobacterium tumefaciens]